MIEAFTLAATAVGAVVKPCPSTDRASTCLAQLAGGEAVAVTRLPSDLQALVAPLSIALPAAHATTRMTVSFAEAGIAATGSLLLDLSDPVDRGATALTPVHAVLLRADSIVTDLAALAPRMKELLGKGRGYLSLTTGPSRTADIERVLTIGVHGPKELHIILLEDRS